MWGLGAVILICAAVYARALGFSFVYDDTSQILNNPTIRSWSFLPQYFRTHVWGYSSVWTNLYRPIFLIALRVCNAMFALDPQGWHGFAIAVHLLDACLVFLVVRKLVGNERIALTTAAIFGLSPVQIETVAWVSGMTDALMSAALLAGLWCYLKGRESGRRPWLIACSVFYAIALLTKESGAVLPLLILAYEVSVGRPSQPKRSFLAGAFGVLAAITLAYFGIRWAVLHSLVGHTMSPVSWSEALYTVPVVVLRYLRMMTLPYGMSAFLPGTYVSAFTGFVIPLLVLVGIIVCVFCWSRWARNSAIAFAALWMFLAMLPVLDLRLMQPNDFVHIRFLYVPSIGFAMLVALALAQLLRKRMALLGVTSVLVVVLAVSTYAQSRYWHDNVSLYQRGVAVAPDNPVPANNLADEFIKAGREEEALHLIDNVLRQHPAYWTANYNRGYLAYKRQDWTATAEYMGRAIANQGLETDAYVYRGFAMMKLGRLQEAEESVRQALALRPQARSYHFTLGLILRQEQRWPEALAAFQQELAINPHDSGAAAHVADIKARLGVK